MTREEAIKSFKESLFYNSEHEPVNMAIEALRVEPCEDCISRQAAIDALERIFDRCEEIEAHLPEGDPDRVGYKMYPDWLKVWKYLRQGSSAQPVDKGYLIDWYISSVDDSEPVWTEAHIKELMNDFYLIPKGVY